MERPGTIAAFFCDKGVEDIDEARTALAQWFEWCIENRWTRAT